MGLWGCSSVSGSRAPASRGGNLQVKGQLIHLSQVISHLNDLQKHFLLALFSFITQEQKERLWPYFTLGWIPIFHSVELRTCVKLPFIEFAGSVEQHPYFEALSWVMATAIWSDLLTRHDDACMSLFFCFCGCIDRNRCTAVVHQRWRAVLILSFRWLLWHRVMWLSTVFCTSL